MTLQVGCGRRTEGRGRPSYRPTRQSRDNGRFPSPAFLVSLSIVNAHAIVNAHGTGVVMPIIHFPVLSLCRRPRIECRSVPPFPVSTS
jgi:hypothetical protein